MVSNANQCGQACYLQDNTSVFNYPSRKRLNTWHRVACRRIRYSAIGCVLESITWLAIVRGGSSWMYRLFHMTTICSRYINWSYIYRIRHFDLHMTDSFNDGNGFWKKKKTFVSRRYTRYEVLLIWLLAAGIFRFKWFILARNQVVESVVLIYHYRFRCDNMIVASIYGNIYNIDMHAWLDQEHLEAHQFVNSTYVPAQVEII